MLILVGLESCRCPAAQQGQAVPVSIQPFYTPTSAFVCWSPTFVMVPPCLEPFCTFTPAHLAQSASHTRHVSFSRLASSPSALSTPAPTSQLPSHTCHCGPSPATLCLDFLLVLGRNSATVAVFECPWNRFCTVAVFNVNSLLSSR